MQTVAISRLARPVLLATALLLGGCYTADQARYTGFVTQLVQPGMPVQEALQRLGMEGFACDSARGTAPVACSRSQDRLLPHACSEKLSLLRTDGGKTVARVEVAEIRCTRA